MAEQIRKRTLALTAGLSLLVTAAICRADDEQTIQSQSVQPSVKKTITRKKTVNVPSEFHPPVIEGVPERGYWQPGGYGGRIGSPYYYSVRHWVPASLRAVPHRSDFHGNGDYLDDGSCCGYGRHSSRWSRYADGERIGHYSSGYFSSGHYRGWSGRRGWWNRDPYTYHFGPGYYRRFEQGHYRFPYYSYRSPWYYPGQPVFNRDTNFAW